MASNGTDNKPHQWFAQVRDLIDSLQSWTMAEFKENSFEYTNVGSLQGAGGQGETSNLRLL